MKKETKNSHSNLQNYFEIHNEKDFPSQSKIQSCI